MTEKKEAGRRDILLIEDNRGDVQLALEAFAAAGGGHRVHVVRDGEEAAAFLKKEGAFADRPVPDLILMDLNLPRKDGRELLAEIKSDPALRRIPTLVLSTSRSEKDVQAAYGLHANGFITKPIEYEQLVQIIQKVQDFWFQRVTLP